MSWPADDTRFYYAEWNLHKMGLEARLGDPQGFLDKVLGSRAFVNRWPEIARRPIEIRSRQVNQNYALSYRKENLIYLPPWARTDLVVLHELAHFCAPSKRVVARGKDKGDHGPHFIGAELELVKLFMGKRPYNCLKHSLRAFEIEWVSFERA